MRLFADDLGQAVEVVWYFVPWDRPTIPYAHPFGSRDWDDFRGQLILGEVYDKRVWYDGADPHGLDGQGFCGSQKQWFQGASVADPVRALNPRTGQQCCCGSGAVNVGGGLLLGGDSSSGQAVQVGGDVVPLTLIYEVPDIFTDLGALVFPATALELSYTGPGLRWESAPIQAQTDGLFYTWKENYGISSPGEARVELVPVLFGTLSATYGLALPVADLWVSTPRHKNAGSAGIAWPLQIQHKAKLITTPS
jgi:hypothetical protein